MDDRTAYRIAVLAIYEMAKPLAVDANLARRQPPPLLPRQQKALEDYERLMQAAAILEGKAQQGRMEI